MADQSCLPWWITKFDGVPAFTVSKPGCKVGSDGNVPCDPEALRADAEAQMNAAGYGGGLSLEAYTLARYLQSEVGTSKIAQSIAVTEAAINRSRNLSRGVLSLLLYRQSPGHPNYGHYGPIHGVGTGTSTAPYGRWAATSRDPSLKALVIAQFVIDGYSDNFTGGADDQDGPEYWAKDGRSSFGSYVRGLASKGKYWVGPLPGIDHWHTFLQFTPGISASSAEGQALTQRGIAALQLPVTRPDWSGLPICSEPLSAKLGIKLSRTEMVLLALAGLGGLAGAVYFDRWLGNAKSV
jgi:hypothetical protein